MEEERVQSLRERMEILEGSLRLVKDIVEEADFRSRQDKMEKLMDYLHAHSIAAKMKLRLEVSPEYPAQERRIANDDRRHDSRKTDH